jgi:hypothetical protein
VALDAIIKAIKQEAHLYQLCTGVYTFYDIENALDIKNKIQSINNSPQSIDSALIQTADIIGW